MKNLAMVGFFGWGNFGDELFISAHRQHLGSDYDLIVANPRSTDRLGVSV